MMKSSIGLNLRVTGHCNQGGRKYMEDAFVVAYQQNEDQNDLEYAYFGIFDGHGGREAALFAKEHLMDNIVSQKGFWSNDDQHVLQAIRSGFLTTHQAMWREVGKWPKTMSGLPSTSGTTSSIAFIRRRKLYIGHVGDSKIVLGFQLPGSSEWCACALTKDHKPESPEERLRIHRVGGLVLNKAGVDRVVWNRPRPGHKGPIRRSTPFDQIPFLAVARSLGDLWSYNYLRDEFVVSPDPDVKVVNINPHMHRCVIFASDGLWNMLTTQRAVKIVQSAEEENEQLILEGNKSSESEKQPSNPSKLLVDVALKHWFNLRMRADNTSVVTVMLDPTGPPRSHVLLRQKAMKRLRPRDEHMIDDEDDEIFETSSIASDCSEYQTFKERRKPSDLLEPPIKGRKLTCESDETVPRNLPKPVIMNPRKVPKCDSSPGNKDGTPKPPESSASSPCPVYLIKSRKRSHEPPKGGGDSGWKSDNILSPRERTVFGQGEASMSKLPASSKDKSVPNIPSGKTDLLRSKCEKREAACQKNLSYSNSKENGRVHLCEVDNFFKLNDRTTESPKPSISPKLKSVPRSSKNFRKSTLSRRTTVFSTVPRSRMSRRNFAGCRTGMTRRSYAHNTRAQSGIRKLKVGFGTTSSPNSISKHLETPEMEPDTLPSRE